MYLLIENRLARELLTNRLLAYLFVKQLSHPRPPVFNNVYSVVSLLFVKAKDSLDRRKILNKLSIF
jgi:hypothetical protein